MRRVLRLLAVACLACSGVALFHPAAAGASTSIDAEPALLQSAWFWKPLYNQINPPVAAPEKPPNEPSGVPKGDVAVAHTSDDDGSSKVTALAFDATALVPGTTIESFTVALTVDPSPEAANLNSAEAPVVACLPTRFWSPVEGGAMSDAPPTDCTGQVKPDIKGDTYVFDVTEMAQTWVDDANLGIALLNDPENTSVPFQAVFKGGDAVKASVTYAAPTVTPTTGGTTTTGTGSTGGTSTTGGTSGAPSFDPGAVPTSGLPPVDTGSTGDAGPPPEVADEQPAAPQVAPVAQVTPAPSTPGAPFWLGVAGAAILLLLASMVLGDPRVPVPDATTSKLGRVLRERERATAALNVRNA